MARMRITLDVLRLLQVFLDDIHESHYGYDLMKATGYASGKLYPMLAKLQAAGWLDSEMEQVDPSVQGRPPRRWYRLSERGLALGRKSITEARQQLASRRSSVRGCGVVQPQGGMA